MASWAKAIKNHSNNQRTAHLYLTFSNIDLANRAITNGLSICNKRCHIEKCRKEPLRCLKGWNHLAKDCIKMDDTCSNCMGKHRTHLCTSTEKKCASCKKNDHASWCRQCPMFIKKLTELNARNLENSTIYFPSNNSWTWTSKIANILPNTRPTHTQNQTKQTNYNSNTSQCVYQHPNQNIYFPNHNRTTTYRSNNTYCYDFTKAEQL